MFSGGVRQVPVQEPLHSRKTSAGPGFEASSDSAYKKRGLGAKPARGNQEGDQPTEKSILVIARRDDAQAPGEVRNGA